MEVTLLHVCLALASTHVMYAFIWLRPASYIRLTSGVCKPVDFFMRSVFVLKFVQSTAVLGWYSGWDAGVLAEAAAAREPWQLAAFAAGTAFGQVLNYSIYHAIGKEGVFYGCKLGYRVPWCTGFPFNVFRHPQYVGWVAQVWAIVALLYDASHTVMVPIGLFWTGCYVVTGIIEDYL
mmetsp:Transcript_20579/g.69993  ORF Transcript_20579/g.69993 Transcript_20579/m.69993 type:complete len:178 (-) Transcript_20579:37-570(-)